MQHLKEADKQHVVYKLIATVHCFAGLLGEQAYRLFAILLIILNLHSVAPLSLSVDQPRSPLRDVVLFDSDKNSLIAIVTCDGGQLQAQVNEDVSSSFGIGFLQLHLEENSNKPNEFFILPNNTGVALLPEGIFSIDVLCSNQSISETAVVVVSILGPSVATGANQPYFTNSPRSVIISEGTPPGTVITNYKAEVRVRETVSQLHVVVHCM